MAQLAGFNAGEDVEIKFSFRVPSSFTEKSPDGWGYAFFKDGEWQLFKQSLDMEKILRIDTRTLTPHVINGKTFISHIRFATHGSISYENTHPFDRELFDKRWVFAHHGHLRIYRNIVASQEFYKPAGDTDSESAFCLIMDELRRLGRQDSSKIIAQTIEKKALELSKQGGLNFILSDGEITYTFYSGYKSLYYHTLQPPFKSVLEGGDDQLRFKIDLTEKTTPITLIASMPILKYVHWKEFEPGKVVVFKNGEQAKQLY
ncbi:MAG: class II glutamine amidotransferase [Candidatus Heimdallarchaeota archaeon]|nr:class II glutamine amidotransferase [Candidatus Heimdallarchaeota archaeon]MCK4876686.1 class II glutamine amidotransferase [Candidatus Heimdallarchaeota archaeon]